MADWKYDGFISYSTRADSVLADRIQVGLERLAKPWNRRKALKIFQDIDDLAASSDLSTSLRSELEASNTLVYLASPESAASPWCGDELAYWINARPPEQLVVVLTDGTLVFDKDASPPIDFERSTAAPPAFAALSSVPLYVDMRDIGETDDLDHRTNPEFRARLTKVAAALHSNKTGQAVEPRDIDSLDLREHRRTKRIRNGAIAALTILTIGAVVAAIFALLNAWEADRQRDEAQLQSANALARVALVDVDADVVGALDTAAGARGLVANDVTEAALHQLLWATRPLIWTVEASSNVTSAVPVGDSVVFGTATGELVVVARNGVPVSVVGPRDAAIVDITADPYGPIVAVAWDDGRVALVDSVTRELVVGLSLEVEPTAIAPYPSVDGGMVVGTRASLLVVRGDGEQRQVGSGVSAGVRLRVDRDTVTYADGVVVEIDLPTGSASLMTPAQWIYVDAVDRHYVTLDLSDREGNSVDGFELVGEGSAIPTFDGWSFDRRFTEYDDMTLSADTQRVAVLSERSLDVFERAEFGDGASSVLAVSGVADPIAPDRRVELDATGSVAVTVAGAIVQRWEVGRSVVRPERPPPDANNGFIAVDISSDTVTWGVRDSGIERLARLDLATGRWAYLEVDDVEAVSASLSEVATTDGWRPSPDGTLSARLRGGRVVIRSEPSGRTWRVVDAAADAGHLAFSPDGRYLVLASRGGGLEYWPLRLEDMCPELDRRVRPGTAALAGCGTE